MCPNPAKKTNHQCFTIARRMVPQAKQASFCACFHAGFTPVCFLAQRINDNKSSLYFCGSMKYSRKRSRSQRHLKRWTDILFWGALDCVRNGDSHLSMRKPGNRLRAPTYFRWVHPLAGGGVLHAYSRSPASSAIASRSACAATSRNGKRVYGATARRIALVASVTCSGLSMPYFTVALTPNSVTAV